LTDLFFAYVSASPGGVRLTGETRWRL